MSKLSLQQRWALAIIITVLVNVAVWLYGLSPALDNVKEIKAELAEVKSEKTGLEQRLARLNAIDVDTLAMEKELLDINLPPTGRLPEFLIYLEEKAAELDLDLGSIRASQFRDAEPYFAMDLTVDITGSYAGVYSYLRQLEENQRLLLIRSFTLNESSGNISTGINLRIFAEDFMLHTPFAADGRKNPFSE